ncbi:hypothetical protein ABZ726_37625 [Streptomyces hundungensis]|uniref:hypothetical protein n=1 Tax=Streptomyces hundungensis TaxID=1077946 RepID=UPI0033D75D76
MIQTCGQARHQRTGQQPLLWSRPDRLPAPDPPGNPIALSRHELATHQSPELQTPMVLLQFHNRAGPDARGDRACEVQSAGLPPAQELELMAVVVDCRASV